VIPRLASERSLAAAEEAVAGLIGGGLVTLCRGEWEDAGDGGEPDPAGRSG
jgi:hypothetical protein